MPHLTSFPFYHVWPHDDLFSMFLGAWNINPFNSTPGLPPQWTAVVSSAAGPWWRHPGRRAPPWPFHRVLTEQRVCGTLLAHSQLGPQAALLLAALFQGAPNRLLTDRQPNQILPYSLGACQVATRAEKYQDLLAHHFVSPHICLEALLQAICSLKQESSLPCSL